MKVKTIKRIMAGCCLIGFLIVLAGAGTAERPAPEGNFVLGMIIMACGLVFWAAAAIFGNCFKNRSSSWEDIEFDWEKRKKERFGLKD